MGIPQKPCLSLICHTSATVLVGLRHRGSVMKPFSNLKESEEKINSCSHFGVVKRRRTYFLTAWTISAWSWGGKLWWITPSPPRSCTKDSRHFQLSFRCEIVYWESTYSDSDSHFSLGNGIHRWRKERSFEDSLFGNPWLCRNCRSREIDMTGKNQEILYNALDKHAMRKRRRGGSQDVTL